MINFNTEELDIAKEIINIGLGKAADSMAFFTKEKVLIRSFDLRLNEFKDVSHFTEKKDDEKIFILTTEIKGDLGGICYLVFSEKEVEQILKVSLSEDVLSDPAKYAMMSEAILLEMDNIIVASVVTQFSNFFKATMYGDVPAITVSNSKGLKNIVEKSTKATDYILYFKSEFHTTGMDINPEFIWLLDEKYVDGVQGVANDEELLLKMRAQL